MQHEMQHEDDTISAPGAFTSPGCVFIVRSYNRPWHIIYLQNFIFLLTSGTPDVIMVVTKGKRRILQCIAKHF